MHRPVAGRINPVGAGAADLVYATYIGGTGHEQLSGQLGGLAVDGSGRLYLAGATSSVDFPMAGANGSFDATRVAAPSCGSCPVIHGGFVAMLDPSLATDGTGVPSATNQQLVWSTYFSDEGNGNVEGVAIGPSGKVYLTGSGEKAPTTPGAYESSVSCSGFDCGGYIAVLDPAAVGDGSGVPSAANPQLVYSTFLGGTGMTSGQDIAVDADGNAWVTGVTTDTGFPTKSAIRASCGCAYLPSLSDGIVVRLNPGGNGEDDMMFATYMGGARRDVLYAIDLDPAGSAYVTGFSLSYKNSDGHLKLDRYPVTPNAFQLNNPGGSIETSDAVVSKIKLP